MARTGRQPKPKSTPSTSTATNLVPRKSKPLTKKQQAKKVAQATVDSSLDIYSQDTKKRKARGDIDPQARKNNKPSRSKGKNREEQEDEDEDQQDQEEMFGSGRVVDFTGIKPAGLKMGLESDGDDGGDDDDDDADDDEDIDSDNAGSDSDSEKEVEKLDKTKKAGKKPGNILRRSAEINLDEDQVDLNEEQDDEDDDDSAGYIDASTMLDMDLYGTDASESGSDEKHDGDDDDEMDSVDSDDEHDSEYEGALDKLSSFVENLEGSMKRKSGENEDEGVDGAGKKKKRVVLKERAEAYPEGEFVAVGAIDSTSNAKVQLDDLLASFSESKNPKLAALRKTLIPLAASSSGPNASTSKSHLTAGALAAPLPARLQDKIDREAAYEKTKEETDKWNETVRRMKGVSGLGVEGARHERLTLPLMPVTGDVQRDANSNEWAANFEPSNQLEASIHTLLAAGQMSTSDLRKAEQQALNALDPEDLAARQAELRAQRDLMFRAERKAKRVAKIKSKTFRRIHRRAKGKDGEAGLSIEELAELDAIDGGTRVDHEQAKLEIARAKERATLKHSSKGGRWSRTDIGGLEGLDEERNTAVREMVARKEALTKRIQGKGDEDDESDSDLGVSDEEDHEAGDLNSIRRKAFDELASLEAKEQARNENGPKLKGVLNMKFMKDAIARDDRKVQQSTDELRKRLERMDEMGGALDLSGSDEGEQDEGPAAHSEQIQGNTGRMVFGPSGAQKQSSSSHPTGTAEAATSRIRTSKLSAPMHIDAPARSSPLTAAPETSSSNPWLTLAAEIGSISKLSRKSNEASHGKDLKAASKMAAKVDRRKSKLEDAREAEKDDARVEIDSSNSLAPVSTTKGKTGRRQSVVMSEKANAKLTMAEEDLDSSDEEEGDLDAQRGKGKTAFEQRELVAKAFAGDDVVADFEEQKRLEIERDAPKEIDETLPGWGAWSGKGVRKSKKPQKKFIKQIPGIAPENRQDAKFSHVIMSEKKDKKASKYLLKDLPFPYTSVAQHEHKLRTPMGPEWSTSTVLRDQTLPSVLIKPGVTIRPVERKI